MSQVVNLFGGPGIGKSSIAAGIIHQLKRNHVSCDAPYEFPKVLAWDNNESAIRDQFYVIANQHRGIAKAYNKVNHIIVDSPILLSLIYKNYYVTDPAEYPSCLYGKEFDDLLLSIHNSYDSLNILLTRADETSFNEKERYQDFNQSLDIDSRIKAMLDTHHIPYIEVAVDTNPVDQILTLINPTIKN